MSKANAQRIYASTQAIATTGVLAGVSNAAYAVDSPYTNYSTLTSVVLGSAAQNLHFGTVTPTPSTPVVVKFSTSGGFAGLLQLVNGTTVTLTNNGINNPVGTAYSSAVLLNLLNLFPDTGGEIIFPVQNVTYDGIKISLSGLAAGLYVYYAFFIVAPQTNNVSVCSGSPAAIPVNNFQNGYTYRLYDGNTIIASSTSSSVLTPPLSAPVLTTKVYQLEALENNMYPSGKTEVSVTIHPNPEVPASAHIN